MRRSTSSKLESENENDTELAQVSERLIEFLWWYKNLKNGTIEKTYDKKEDKMKVLRKLIKKDGKKEEKKRQRQRKI